jgi:hypothetical protein
MHRWFLCPGGISIVVATIAGFWQLRLAEGHSLREIIAEVPRSNTLPMITPAAWDMIVFRNTANHEPPDLFPVSASDGVDRPRPCFVTTTPNLAHECLRCGGPHVRT